jgi:signal peptidase I
MVIYLVNLFIGSVFVVSGESMEPNFHDKEYLLVNKIGYTISTPKRGDVVVFKFPGELDQKYIKRVVGLPGDTIEIKNNGVYVNNQKLLESYIPVTTQTAPLVNQTKWTVKDKEYFVMGDNRENSNDSRVWGVLPKEYLIGKIIYSIYPISNLNGIINPNYYSSK